MAVYYKFGSVRTDDKVTDDKPISALLLVDVRRSKTPLLKFNLPFVRLFHTSSPLRSIELSVKTLNVRARARHSAKIKMVNGYPLHLDYTT